MKIRGEGVFLSVLVLVVCLPAVALYLQPPRGAIVLAWIALIGVLLVLCAFNWNTSQGFRVMAAGVAANLAVIAANQAMPVSGPGVMSIGGAAALAAAHVGDSFHSLGGIRTHLLLLGDVLPLPGFPGFRAMLSVGDVIMFVGIVIVLVGFPDPRLQESRQTRSHASGCR